LRTSGFSSSINEIKYLNNLYIGVGTNGIINVSTDAITWVLRTAGQGANSIRRINYGYGTYISGGVTANPCFISTDTIVWQSRNISTSQGVNAVVVDNNLFVVSGGSVSSVTAISSSPIASGGTGGSGVKGGGGGGGGYDEVNNLAGSGGTGGDGYVRISWV
jgi:hypothetical protein